MIKDRLFTPSQPLFRYGLSLVVSAFAFVLTRGTMPIFEHNAFDFYLGAVVISAYYGGLGPAFLTALLAIPTLSYFFMPPFNAFSLAMTDVLRLTVFTIVALLVSSLSGRLKKAKSDLQQAHDELETRVEERTRDLMRVNGELETEIEHRLAAEKEILQISNREQRRLGEDLHDGLCQTLVGLRYLTQDLRDRAAADGLAWTEEVGALDKGLGDALHQADGVAHGLYPVELETGGLVPALQSMADKIAVIYRVRCRLRCDASPTALEGSTAHHMYRIAQEAIVNAIKRGKSKRISLRLQRRRERVQLSVTDDGIGLSQQSRARGLGLKMMEYRARMIHAAFRIRSRAKGVTRVTCSLELNSEATHAHLE